MNAPNVIKYEECPSLGTLMDERVREVFDVGGKHPELEDSVRLVGISYVSPIRRPNGERGTVMEEAEAASQHYKVAILP